MMSEGVVYARHTLKIGAQIAVDTVIFMRISCGG
jgi:hypothetical protein